MARRLVLRLVAFSVCALTTINIYLYLSQSVCYTARNETEELWEITEEPDPVMSALRDVVVATPYDRPEDTSECSIRLFSRRTSAYNFSMSEDYRANLGEFLSAVSASVVGAPWVEGHSYELDAQYRLLQYLTRRLPFVRTVCETGFNAGHSSFNFLTARRDVNVHSFDLGFHRYVSPMASFLRRKFPGRLTVELGDSREAVPRYFKLNTASRPTTSAPSCDLMLIDGGHVFDVVLSDIYNFARVASRPHNVIIVDDTNDRQVLTAWQAALSSGIVQQIFACTFDSDKARRAFALGVVGRQKNCNCSRVRKSNGVKDSTGLPYCVYICLSIFVVFTVILAVLCTQ